MKNVLIVMLALIVFFSALNIPLKNNGLAYEETLNEFLSITAKYTEKVKSRIEDVSDVLSFFNGSNIVKFDEYQSFTVHYWTDVVNNVEITQYLIIGQKTIWAFSETFVYCTIDGVQFYDFTWSWSHMYRMLNLRTLSGTLITSVGRGRNYEIYSNAQELSDYMATVPELASYREIFEAGR